MNKIIFILGGARSGKSTFAIKLAKDSGKKKIAFIATGQALDEEMEKRIMLHKRVRPVNFKTFEEPCDVEVLLKKITGKFDLIIIDCLTLFVSNLLLKKYKEEEIYKKMGDILTLLNKINAKTIIISNEVGLGIVPASKLGRDFRDIAGKVNQLTVQQAKNVFFMVSGIPWRIK
ncbi:MAG: bifunctional adenosylcobinamide kinase/adenosylcobinamide-phosphate guanylyltransferase [Candidatus Omnitrophota bacterium]|jgi:adenosylcobinamide kinase/adenosylcobinamide-phosphate guanylyltransferase